MEAQEEVRLSSSPPSWPRSPGHGGDGPRAAKERIAAEERVIDGDYAAEVD